MYVILHCIRLVSGQNPAIRLDTGPSDPAKGPAFYKSGPPASAGGRISASVLTLLLGFKNINMVILLPGPGLLFNRQNPSPWLNGSVSYIQCRADKSIRLLTSSEIHSCGNSGFFVYIQPRVNLWFGICSQPWAYDSWNRKNCNFWIRGIQSSSCKNRKKQFRSWPEQWSTV